MLLAAIVFARDPGIGGDECRKSSIYRVSGETNERMNKLLTRFQTGTRVTMLTHICLILTHGFSGIVVSGKFHICLT
jgi:hypothetical protein